MFFNLPITSWALNPNSFFARSLSSSIHPITFVRSAFFSFCFFVANEPKTASGARKIRLTQIVIDGLEEQKRYIAAIRRHAGSAWKENDLLFPNKHGGYLDRWVISQQFQRVLEKAGLPYMRLHDLRHSAATLLLAAGVNVKVVQEMLGHSDIRITLQMYSHVMPDMQKDAADKMNDMFQ